MHAIWRILGGLSCLVLTAGTVTFSAESAQAAGSRITIEVKAWIPQARIPGPAPADTSKCRPGWSDAGSSLSYGGDNHIGYDGSHRVAANYSFDWDGKSMTNGKFGSSIGETHAYLTYPISWPRPYYDDCVLAKTAPGYASHVFNPQVPFALTMTLNSKNPLVSGAPAIDSFFEATMVGPDKMSVRYTTDTFPSHGFRIIKDGIVVATAIDRDASCVSGMDNIAIGLTAGTGTPKNVVTHNIDLRASNQISSQPCAGPQRAGFTYPAVSTNGGSGGGTTTPPVTNTAPIPAWKHARIDGAGNLVDLDASDSSDPGGAIARYEWFIGDTKIGEGVKLRHAFGSQVSPTVRLLVTDNQGAIAEKRAVLSLGNRTPVIIRPNPADGVIVGSNQPNLSATVSDPDGDRLKFNYRITGPYVDRQAVDLQGGWTVPPNTLDPGETYTWTVTVNDGRGGVATASRRLTIAMLPIAADVVSTASGKGYWQIATDGGVFSYGDAQFYGSVPAVAKIDNAIGMSRTPSGRGYWVVGRDGGVFSFGDAKFFGSLPGQNIRVTNIVGMVPTKTGGGYWLVGSDGGVFSFGDAPFHGSMGGKPLNAPVEAIAATKSGAGYWLVARDGGIFSFGDAPFYGSMGGKPLNSPVVDMDVTPDGGGYWLTAEDGGVFTFGNASFFGSMGGKPLNGRVTGMASTPSGKGYWLNACDGGVFTFGDAPFLGSNPTYMCRGIQY